MDLKIKRNLEQFFQLMGEKPAELDEKIECHFPPFGILLELEQGRLLMTSWLLEHKTTDVLPLLSRCHPEVFIGLPQRLYIVKNSLMISCLLPSDSEGMNWYRICKAQRKFLSNVLKGGLL